MFKINYDANIYGTHYHDEIVTNYSTLEDLLGPPGEGDGYKISGRWVFEDDRGQVVTLYDWKETELYDDSYESSIYLACL